MCLRGTTCLVHTYKQKLFEPVQLVSYAHWLSFLQKKKQELRMKEYQRQLREELEVEDMQRLHEKVWTFGLQQVDFKESNIFVAPMEHLALFLFLLLCFCAIMKLCYFPLWLHDRPLVKRKRKDWTGCTSQLVQRSRFDLHLTFSGRTMTTARLSLNVANESGRVSAG